jgi:hypothetical protein
MDTSDEDNVSNLMLVTAHLTTLCICHDLTQIEREMFGQHENQFKI